MVDIESFLENRELEETTKLDIFQMKPVTGLTELDEVAQGLAQGHPNLPGPLLLHFYNTVTGKCLFFIFFPPCISL